MKHTTIKIKIAEPCHENWDKMMEEEKGRFCLSCQKAVVDFSRMTNEEIIHYFEQNAGKKTCGRIATHQHNTPISNYRKVITPWFNRYVAGFLMALGFYNPSTAQTDKTPTERHMIKGEIEYQPKLTGKKFTVKGRVLDEKTKKGIVGATVSITGADLSVTTDKNGNYIMDIPERFQTSFLQLIVTFLGYDEITINNIDQSKTSVSFVTKMHKQMDYHIMGDVLWVPEEPSPKSAK